MHQMIELHPRADALDMLGLPSIPYPVALPAFQAAVANDGELPLADMLHGLQLRAAEAADWQRLEPAMTRLAELLAAEDARETVSTRGDDWWLEIGPVDLDGELIALQRGHSLLAALVDRGDGRLRVAAWHPLDAHAMELLTALAVVPAARDDLGDPPSSWQRAREAAVGCCHDDRPGDQGRSLLSYWCDGIAADGDGVPPEWRGQAAQPPRRPACVAAEIETWQLFQG